MEEKKTSSSHIVKKTAITTAAIFFSRIFGLIREQVFGIYFGASVATDCYQVAFRIPNLLRDIFGEGALSAAFVSVFVSEKTLNGDKKAFELANTVFVAFSILVSILVILGIIFSPEIIYLFTQESFYNDPIRFSLTNTMTKIMMPFLLFMSLSAITMGILNSYNRFFVPSFASSFFNIGSIVFGLSFAILFSRTDNNPIIGMAIGAVIGGFLQFAFQIPSLYKCGFKFKPSFTLFSPEMRKIYYLMGPAMIGLAALEINQFVNTNYASSLEAGSISWLNYAFRLMQLPIGLFGVSISIVAMPLMAKYASLKDNEGYKDAIVTGLTIASFLAIPSSIFMWFLSEPIIRIIYEHGRFSTADTMQTAVALQFYIIGLFSYSCIKITASGYYALKSPKIPVIGSFITLIFNVIFINLFIDKLGHKGIALSTSLSLICNFMFQLVFLHIKLKGLPLKVFVFDLVKITFAGAVFIPIYYLATLSSLENIIINDLLKLAITGIFGGFFYIAILYFLKVKELGPVFAILGKLRARF